MAAKICGLLVVSFAMVIPQALAAEPDSNVSPIQKLERVQPKQHIFEAASAKEPLVLHNLEKAREYFEEGALKAIAEKVDFTQQVVLVFAWRGSGQDRLESIVAESYPEQVTFTLVPGRTRDLRPHVEIYALRSNVKWKVR